MAKKKAGKGKGSSPGQGTLSWGWMEREEKGEKGDKGERMIAPQPKYEESRSITRKTGTARVDGPALPFGPPKEEERIETEENGSGKGEVTNESIIADGPSFDPQVSEVAGEHPPILPPGEQPAGHDPLSAPLLVQGLADHVVSAVDPLGQPTGHGDTEAGIVAADGPSLPLGSPASHEDGDQDRGSKDSPVGYRGRSNEHERQVSFFGEEFSSGTESSQIGKKVRKGRKKEEREDGLIEPISFDFDEYIDRKYESLSQVGESGKEVFLLIYKNENIGRIYDYIIKKSEWYFSLNICMWCYDDDDHWRHPDGRPLGFRVVRGEDSLPVGYECPAFSS